MEMYPFIKTDYDVNIDEVPQLRVLFIADRGILGGATRSLVELVTELRRIGVDCIVCTSADNELNKELACLDIPNFSAGYRPVMDTRPKNKWKVLPKILLNGGLYWLCLPKALKRIETEIDLNQIDLIHTNSTRVDIGAILSKKYGIPHVVHIREFGKEDFDCWSYRLRYMRFLNESAGVFLAISAAVKRSWSEKGIETNKIRVIYNGINNKDIFVSNVEKMRDDTVLKMVITGGV